MRYLALGLLGLFTFAPMALADYTGEEEIGLLEYDGGTDRAKFSVKSGNYSNPAGCSSTSYYEIPSEYHPEKALKVLLAAKLAGLTVRLNVSEGECGTFGRPVVKSVQLK